MIQTYESASDASAVIIQLRQNELNERISRWLMGVEQAYDTTFISTSSAKSKRRLSKPYTRAEPHLRVRISSGTHVVEDNRWPPPEVLAIPVQEAERGAFESRTASPVAFRGLDELPEPNQNPLVRLLF